MAKRSKEFITVGYFLSKYGKKGPPNSLKVNKWKDAYSLFYKKLGDGKELFEFINSLNNSRDIFDGHFNETQREGWKDKAGKPSKLTGLSLEVFNEFKSLTEEDFITKIKYCISPFKLSKNKKYDTTVIKLLNRYKQLILSKGLSNEKYKWEFLRDFKGKPDLTGNIFEEIKSIKFGNLMYHLSTACIKDIAKDYGLELTNEFEGLRNESTDLVERITTFNKNTLKLYRKLGKTMSHHQDERSMSVYLTLHNPGSYTFYKNQYYQEYCKLIGEKKAKTKEKYAHYLYLIKDLAENFISKDKELLSSVEMELGELTKQDPNYLLLAQDMLYQLLNTSRDKKYWIYAPGENADQWDEFYQEGVMAISWDKLGDLNKYGDRNDIKKALKEEYGYTNNPMNHSLANYEFRDVISIGDIIIPKRGRDTYLGYGIVTSDYYYDSKLDAYTSRRKVNWKKKGNWGSEGFQIALKTLTDITKYPDYVEELIKLIGIEEGNNLQNTNTSDMAHSLNTIFYGPPGTGKTYKLSKELFPKYTDSTESKSREELLDELVSDYKWFDIMAAVVYQLKPCKVNDISNHELIQAKARVSSSKNIKANIWGKLQAHTDLNCEIVRTKGRHTPQIMWKNEGSLWRFHDEFEEDSIASSIELLERSKNLHSGKNEVIKRYEFTTFHQSFSYEDFIEGIKPIMNGENEGEVQYEIQDGIFKRISTKARNNPEQQYALFIDEINRGNVANIFGELITLIEPDKREGEENELSVVLPYSKKSFSVPKNIDIIGTMNTADRSVEALDTALRRRFSFIEMTPTPKVLKDENITCGKVDIPKFLDTINLRIEKLLDKDHCIGHSYFFKLKKDSSLSMLQGIFKDNIIPLLQEYFYGDFGKIGLVLGKAFVTESNTSKDVFHTDFSYEDRDLLLERKVYEFTDVSKLSVEDFISIYG